MAFIHGKNTWLSFGTVTLTPYLNNVDSNRDVATADTTVFGVSGAQFLNGNTTSTYTATGLFDAAVSSALAAYNGGTAQTLTFAPAGTSAGNPKETSSAILSAYNKTGNVAEAVGLALTFMVSGTVTDSWY